MTTSLIIGASRGLGLEWVRQLRTRGDTVLATARDRAGLERITALGAEAIELDVTDEQGFPGLARRLADRDLGLVVLNAGVFSQREGATVAPARADFDRLMRTNVFAALAAIPVLAPLLAPRQGLFVAISSDMGSIAAADSSMGLPYRASKAALNMVIRGAALDHPAVGFLAQSPGWVRTEMGGPEAPLDVRQSVAAMIANVDSFRPELSGAFLGLDGATLPT